MQMEPIDAVGVPIRTVCAWCAHKGITTVIVDGVLDEHGRCSHGVCPNCKEGIRASIRGALPEPIGRRGPVVVLGAQIEKAGLRGGLAVVETKSGVTLLADAEATRTLCVAHGIELKR